MARTTTRSTQQDNRKDNFQPNHLPATIRLVIAYLGEKLGSIAIEQNAKVSEKGNISFSGGIADGWSIPGAATWMDALSGLSFEASGVTLKAASTGVHTSKSGNPTVCHTAVVELASTEGEPVRRYMLQVYATWLGDERQYNLSASAFPVAVGRKVEQVRGEVDGLVVAPRS